MRKIAKGTPDPQIETAKREKALVV